MLQATQQTPPGPSHQCLGQAAALQASGWADTAVTPNRCALPKTVVVFLFFFYFSGVGPRMATLVLGAVDLGTLQKERHRVANNRLGGEGPVLGFASLFSFETSEPPSEVLLKSPTQTSGENSCPPRCLESTVHGGYTAQPQNLF